MRERARKDRGPAVRKIESLGDRPSVITLRAKAPLVAYSSLRAVQQTFAEVGSSAVEQILR